MDEFIDEVKTRQDGAAAVRLGGTTTGQGECLQIRGWESFQSVQYYETILSGNVTGL